MRIWYNKEVDQPFAEQPSSVMNMMSDYEGTLDSQAFFNMNSGMQSLDALAYFELPRHRARVAYFNIIKSHDE